MYSISAIFVLKFIHIISQLVEDVQHSNVLTESVNLRSIE